MEPRIPKADESKNIDYVGLLSMVAGAQSMASKRMEEGKSEAEIIHEMLGDQKGAEALENQRFAAEAHWSIGWNKMK